MALIYGKEDAEREVLVLGDNGEEERRKGWHTLLYFANLVFILIFAAWAKPQLRIPEYADSHSGNIRTLNRRYPDTLPADLILNNYCLTAIK